MSKRRTHLDFTYAGRAKGPRTSYCLRWRHETYLDILTMIELPTHHENDKASKTPACGRWARKLQGVPMRGCSCILLHTRRFAIRATETISTDSSGGFWYFTSFSVRPHFSDKLSQLKKDGTKTMVSGLFSSCISEENHQNGPFQLMPQDVPREASQQFVGKRDGV